MMHASLSTVIMTVITTNILLILLAVCFRKQEWMIRVGYKMLALFAIFAVLRFVLPVEFPFTITKKLPGGLSWIIAACRYPLFVISQQEVSLWTLFLVVWSVGAAVGIGRFTFDYWRISHQIVLCGKELTNKTLYKNLLNAICVENRKRNCFRVIEVPGLKTPILFGIFSPRILLPDNMEVSDSDLYYILKHEMMHHFHHDMLLKVVVRLITLVYWWDPFCILLNKQTDIILEMHVDDAVTTDAYEPTTEYMKCLIRTGEEILEKHTAISKYTVGALPPKTSELNKRFRLLSDKKPESRAAANILVVAVAFSVYVFSYMYIWEPYGISELGLFSGYDQAEEENIFVPKAENSYFIDREDGSYDLYYYSEYLMTVDSLEYYDREIPIYTAEDYSE